MFFIPWYPVSSKFSIRLILITLDNISLKVFLFSFIRYSYFINNYFCLLDCFYSLYFYKFSLGSLFWTLIHCSLALVSWQLETKECAIMSKNFEFLVLIEQIFPYHVFFLPNVSPRFLSYTYQTKFMILFILSLSTRRKIRNKPNKRTKKQSILEWGCYTQWNSLRKTTHFSLCPWVSLVDSFLDKCGIQCLHSHLSTETPCDLTLFRSCACC